MANFSFSGSYSSSADGWKCNGSSTATGTCSALFSNSYTIDELSINFSGYRSSGSGTSSTDSPGLLWTLTGSNGGYASGNIMLRFSTSQQLSYTDATISNISGQFSGSLTLKVSDPNGTITSCNLYVQDAAIYGTSANVTSYIYYYNGSIQYDYDTYSGPPGSSFSYYLASAPSKTGYSFNGWGTSSSSSSGSAAGAKKTGYYGDDEYWYATWKINTYTINYVLNGGSGTTSATKTYGQNLTLSTPSREGYTFLGWDTSSSAATVIYQPGASYTSNASITLYAVWKVLSYDVTFFNSKDGINIQEPIVESLEYGSQVDLTSSRNFIRPGYKFLGWGKTEDSTDILSEYTVTTSNLQALYSLWELMSNIRVYTDENWQIAIPYIYDGENWKLSISKVFNGEEWSQ